MGSHSFDGLMTPACHFDMTLAIHHLETDIHIGFFFWINIGFSFKKMAKELVDLCPLLLLLWKYIFGMGF